MLPNDAITIGAFSARRNEIITVLSNDDDITIISIGMANDGNSVPQLFCGNDLMAQNVPNSTGVTFTNIVCDDDIIYSNTSAGGGAAEGSVILNYVPYNRQEVSTSSSDIGYNPNPYIASTSDVQIYGALSAGEILIAFILLLQVFIGGLYMLVKSLGAIKTHRKYIEYRNGDVPINNDL